MHFVAMMGFKVQQAPIHYDRSITFASLGVAIVMVGIGIFIVGANLMKYPAFRFGPHYAAATKRQRRP